LTVSVATNVPVCRYVYRTVALPPDTVADPSPKLQVNVSGPVPLEPDASNVQVDFEQLTMNAVTSGTVDGDVGDGVDETGVGVGAGVGEVTGTAAPTDPV
jgi:hypothetical protein